MILIADETDPGNFTEMFSRIGDNNALAVILERKTATANRQDIVGLDDVLREAPSGRPIVMLGWFGPEHPKYADDARWHAALGYPNVVFRQLPEGIEAVAVSFKEALARKRPADPLAIALLTSTAIDREKGILLHDLHYAERDAERMATWIIRARACLGEHLSQTELFEVVKDGRALTEVLPQFAGKEFPDVCVDIEGTLFASDSTLRENVLKLAESRAKSEGRPITIWTGGDMETVRPMVRRAGIPYKLVPKQLLRGATVHTVLDDLPEKDFWKTYGIRCGMYRQI